MARAIILLLFFSHLSFADNTLQITYKGSGSSITTKQIGSNNATYILCGSPTSNGSGTFPGTTYVAHTCSNATWNSTVDGTGNTVRMYTVWSNHTNSRNTITIDGNDISSTNSDGDLVFKGNDGGNCTKYLHVLLQFWS